MALPCHLGGLAVVGAGKNSPLPSMRPPAPVACSDLTVHCPCRNSIVASRRSSGRRCLSQGPLKVLVSCRPACQPAPTGVTAAAPRRRVCGACGHSAARSSACQRASRLTTGCTCQGLMRALTLACIACESLPGLASSVGSNSACSASVASDPASGPVTLARASTVSACFLDGTVVCTVPSTWTRSAIGACACTLALIW